MRVPTIVVTPAPEQTTTSSTSDARKPVEQTLNPNFLFPRWRPRSSQPIISAGGALDLCKSDSKAQRRINRLAKELAIMNKKMGILGTGNRNLASIIEKALQGQPLGVANNMQLGPERPASPHRDPRRLRPLVQRPVRVAY